MKLEPHTLPCEHCNEDMALELPNIEFAYDPECPHCGKVSKLSNTDKFMALADFMDQIIEKVN